MLHAVHKRGRVPSANVLTGEQVGMLAAPPLDIGSMLPIYCGLSENYGTTWGYFAAFLVYWRGWVSGADLATFH